MEDKRMDYLMVALIAFLGGVVSNIVAPARRGVGGFAAAAIVGIFCGGVAGITASAFGAEHGWQYILSAGCAVLGDRILSNIFARLSERAGYTINTHVYGPSQQNIGQEGGEADVDVGLGCERYRPKRGDTDKIGE